MSSSLSKVPKVVVIGGGTGTFPVISALKQLGVKLSSIIAVSDSGGSTGRIRDEFGFQPVGDLRQALAALAQSDGEDWIRKILLYRFQKGEGLKGHNLGNLILTALQDMTGDTSKALEIAEKIFRLKGQVLPATAENVQLEITYSDGSVDIGEHLLDEEFGDISAVKKISQVQLIPNCQISRQAQSAITAADLIIIGPGDYYASLMAALLPEGMKTAFGHSHAKVAYIVNLMTRLTQTHEMSAAEHVKGIEAVIGKPVDWAILNTDAIRPEALEVYAQHYEYPVIDDLTETDKVLHAPLIAEELIEKVANDTAHRSFLRHDVEKVRALFEQLLHNV